MLATFIIVGPDLLENLEPADVENDINMDHGTKTGMEINHLDLHLLKQLILRSFDRWVMILDFRKHVGI